MTSDRPVVFYGLPTVICGFCNEIPRVVPVTLKKVPQLMEVLTLQLSVILVQAPLFSHAIVIPFRMFDQISRITLDPVTGHVWMRTHSAPPAVRSSHAGSRSGL